MLCYGSYAKSFPSHACKEVKRGNKDIETRLERVEEEKYITKENMNNEKEEAEEYEGKKRRERKRIRRGKRSRRRRGRRGAEKEE